MTDLPHRLSRSVEDYLKAVYALSEAGDPATTRDIADRLEVQPASVSGMVKRLAESELLEHVPYRGVRLTPTGHREALRIVRRHRVLETYLHDRLGYSWDDVHAEAERLEHVVSDRLIDSMATALNDPRHDPHGAPIPDAEGVVERVRHPSLATEGLPCHLVIHSVQDEDPASLRDLQARGLLPGVAIDLAADTAGEVRVRIDGDPAREQCLDRELAARIVVSPREAP